MAPERVPYDVVVIGLGLTGLVAGLAAASRGARTLLVGKGHGTLRFRSGSIDVLGHWEGRPVDSPAEQLPALAAERAEHPYALAGASLEPGLEAVRGAAAAAGLDLAGSLAANRLLATAAGTLRPTCLAPPTMRVDWDGAHVLVAGLAGYRDFQADLVAAVLPAAAARLGVELEARPVTVDLPALHRRHLSGLELARLFEQPGFRGELAAALGGALAGATVVALPAVVGLEGAGEAASRLAGELGVPVAELSTVPPSVPGLRLELALTAALRRAGARIQVGTFVRVAPGSGGRVGSVQLQSPGHPQRVPVGRVVLASGGLASGGLEVRLDGSLRETVAELPVWLPEAALGGLVGRQFFEPRGHPVNLAGVRVDEAMRPLDRDGAPLYENLFAAGGLLAHADRGVEKSADGIACATGWRAGLGAVA
jgi:glycerol-3-phosphate dehydrogenase subunit B